MILFSATEDASGQIHIIGGCGPNSHAVWLTNPTDAVLWAQCVARDYHQPCHIEWHRPFRVPGDAGSLQLPSDREPDQIAALTEAAPEPARPVDLHP